MTSLSPIGPMRCPVPAVSSNNPISPLAMRNVSPEETATSTVPLSTIKKTRDGALRQLGFRFGGNRQKFMRSAVHGSENGIGLDGSPYG